ncbi:MAG: ComEC/Rec2 family competence protein [Acholeplasma sp.]|nr:ComEC/Rec2 family competence protein [Acholeplasma sp.]
MFFVYIIIIFSHYTGFDYNKKVNNKFTVTDINDYEYSKRLTLEKSSEKYHFYYNNDDILIGDIVYIEGDIQKYGETRIPNGYNSYYANLGNGIIGRITGKIVKSEDINYLYLGPRIINQISKNDGDNLNKEYLRLFLGYEISEELDDKINDSSFYYLFNISGIHIFLLLSVLNIIFYRINISRKKQSSFIISILFFITIITTFNLKIIRFLIYFLIKELVELLDIKINNLSIIHITFFSLVIIKPYIIFSKNALIMFIIINALSLLSPLYSNKTFIAKGITISLIVNIILIIFTGTVNLLGIIFSPIMTLIVVYFVFPLTIILFFITIRNGDMDFIYQGFNMLIEYEKKVQINIGVNSQIMLIFMLLLAVTILFVNTKKRAIMLTLFLFVMLIFPTIRRSCDNGTFYFLDVGQGDSAVYISKNYVVVIDAFNSVGSFLRNKGINQIDYLIVSHSDNDHNLESQKLIDSFRTKNVILSKYDNDYNLKHDNIILVESGYYIKNKEFSLEFYGPIKKYDSSKNNNSLVFKFILEENTILFTGDIEYEAEIDIANNYQDRLKSDVLKVAHHGSNTSSNSFIIDYINPQYAIISVGKDNKYGFPSQDILYQFSKSNIIYYRTDINETIILKKDKFMPWRFYYQLE